MSHSYIRSSSNSSIRSASIKRYTAHINNLLSSNYSKKANETTTFVQHSHFTHTDIEHWRLNVVITMQWRDVRVYIVYDYQTLRRKLPSTKTIAWRLAHIVFRNGRRAFRIKFPTILGVCTHYFQFSIAFARYSNIHTHTLRKGCNYKMFGFCFREQIFEMKLESMVAAVFRSNDGNHSNVETRPHGVTVTVANNCLCVYPICV